MPAALASGSATVFSYRGNVTPPADYRGLGRADPPAGGPLGRALRPGRGAPLVLRGVERAEPARLLGRHAGGLLRAVPAHGRGAQGGGRRAARRRPGHRRQRLAAGVPRLLRAQRAAGRLRQHAPLPQRPALERGPGHGERAGRRPARHPARVGARGAAGRPGAGRCCTRSGTPRPTRATRARTSPTRRPSRSRRVLEASGLVEAYSFWTFTDIFEENYFPSVPFHGGFGLLNLHGIPKPTYRAFELLHRLGTEQLPVEGSHETVDAWAVRREAGLTVLLTNHALPRQPIEPQRVRVELADAPPPGAVTLERIDDEPRQRQGGLAGDGAAGVSDAAAGRAAGGGVAAGRGAAPVRIRGRDGSPGTRSAAARRGGADGGVRAFGSRITHTPRRGGRWDAARLGRIDEARERGRVALPRVPSLSFLFPAMKPIILPGVT